MQPVQFSEDMRLIQNHLRSKAGLDLLPDVNTELLCHVCERWKPDDQFYRASDKKNRRFRKTTCKACMDRTRRAWVRDNRGRENKIQRDCRSRKRVAA